MNRTISIALIAFIFHARAAIPQPKDEHPLQVDRVITLSQTGSTRASLYSMSSKIITLGDRTHIAWLDSISDTMVATYDRATGKLSEPVHVGTGADNHGGPALCADSDGYLYIVFGPHHGPFQFMKSARPNDSTDWEPLPDFGNGTYPSLVCDKDDTLHICYRGTGEEPWKLLYQRRPKRGDWSDPTSLVDPDVPGGYTQFGNALTVAPDGSLHLAYHIYDLHPAAGKAAGHLMSHDAGHTWTLADGAPVELPVTPRNKQAFVELSADLDLRVSNVVCDQRSRPYFMANRYKPHNDTLLWYWRDDGWHSKSLKPPISEILDFDPHFVQASTCTFDKDGNLYLAVAVGKGGGWSDPTKEVYVLYSKDLGETFGVLRVSPPDPDQPNWGPSVERPVGHNQVNTPMLIFTHGGPGEGCDDPLKTDVRLAILARE